MSESQTTVRYGSATARWIVAATVLGSGMVFLDGTVVNVALPTIGKDFGSSIGGLQWTINAYTVTLSALLLLGGSLGDKLGRRRIFVVGLIGFTVASVLCALAPNLAILIAARAIQGVAGALLVPGSLSIIAASFHDEDRGRAIGAWSGLAGIAGSVGPFVGGWLIDSVSWRLIFVLNVPLAAAAIYATRHIPETHSSDELALDFRGAGLITLSLATLSYAAIQHQGGTALASGVVGALALVAFIWVEKRSTHPMLPLSVFRSRQFTGANLTTLAVYAALSGAIFLVVLRLQVTLHYSALAAGASLTPFTLVLLVLSPRAGAVGVRIGPRIPMTIGPLFTAAGMLWLSQIGRGDRYISAVLPGVLLFAFGMAITIAPLTAAVLGSVGDTMTGTASGVNNAVARLAGLLAVATLPALAGISTDESVGAGLDTGYSTALVIASALAAAGAVVSFLLIGGKDECQTREPISLVV